MSEATQLIEFVPLRAAEVASWATTAREALAWCSFEGHPVPAEVVASWADEPDCSAYLLVEGSTPVAYGELWIDLEEAEVELAHLIVAPQHRRRGLGATLTRALLAEARDHVTDAFLRVRPENATAYRLYQRIGFRRVLPELEAQWNAQQPAAYAWMQAPAGDTCPTGNPNPRSQ